MFSLTVSVPVNTSNYIKEVNNVKNAWQYNGDSTYFTPVILYKIYKLNTNLNYVS